MTDESAAQEISLGLFHPLLREWFVARYGRATDVQVRAWPLIAAGNNVLIVAPTGTGKTYAAFLSAINGLISNPLTAAGTRILYVSPLKALNNDIRENLLVPLEELRGYFSEKGLEFPAIEVMTRSGDTPGAERQRMLRRPPAILITTPESLNLIVSSPRARAILAGVRTVILDEIHAVIGTKRGTHLITAVERIVPIAGEFQRIGLSATVRPIDETAGFLGGFSGRRDGEAWTYEKRRVEIVRSPLSKEISLSIQYLGRDDDSAPGDTHWEILSRRLKEIVRNRRASLIFVNNRRLAERIAHLMNEGEENLLAYAHHGSLSRELREVVEKRMKSGELSAIVATSSLELGIDIGDLDEVILVETPPSVSQTIQRLGRAGHSVGRVASGLLFPSSGIDLTRAAVMREMVQEQEIEELHPIAAPLDVLAQVIVSMTGIEMWRLADLLGFLRTSYPYHSLTQAQFDGVIEMLEGKHADSRLRELRARVSIDRIAGTIRGKDGVLSLLYSSGGTIPDRGYYALHVHGSDARIGELDEEFVFERKVGDTFALGTQRWRIAAIDHQKVSVVPWDGALNILPFWRAENIYRSFSFSDRIARTFMHWDERIGKPGFADELAKEYGMDTAAAERLEGFLGRQREAMHCGLPHRQRIVVEHTSTKGGLSQVIIHTLWGGRVNYPFGLALSALIRRDYMELDVQSNNDNVAIVLPAGENEAPEDYLIDVPRLLGILSTAAVTHLIEEELEGSGFFGARFRENAGRALLLPRASLKRRMPLWITRLRAKRLFDRVRKYADFPIMIETWRSCIKDEFDLDNLSRLLGEIRDGTISIVETRTATPSPFASSVVWSNTDRYLYADDSPQASYTGATSLSREILKEMVFSDSLRIKIPREIARRFEEKLKRTAPGYSPRSLPELVDWVKERLLVPRDEWEELLSSMERDHELPAAETEAQAEARIRELVQPRGVVALDEAAKIERAFAGDEETLASVVGQWLQFYGPVPESKLLLIFAPAGEAKLKSLISTLVEDRVIVRDLLLQDSSETELCDAENLEHLLAFMRREQAPSFRALPLTQLQLFLAQWQGITRRGESEGDLQASLECLFGFPAHAALWEGEILPARLRGYRRAWVDKLIAETDLEWFGCGSSRASFRFVADGELYPATDDNGSESTGKLRTLFPDPLARYGFWDLHQRSGLSSDRFAQLLWNQVWRGELQGDSFEALRRGISSNFSAEPVTAANPRSSRRSGYGRWLATRPTTGNWYLPAVPAKGDLIDEEELSKDRVRQLLQRYGVLFRELLAHELPSFRWSSLFRSLRIMELSGEVVCGSFFEGILGLQFASIAALRMLGEPLSEDAVYWMSAADPASLCGVDVAHDGERPSRLPSNHLVFHGARLVLVSKKNGRELEIRAAPVDPLLSRLFGVFRDLLSRDWEPLKSIKVELVNGEPVRDSPFRGALAGFGFQEDFKSYTLWAD